MQDIKITAYHEAGHVAFAYIFSDLLEIEYVTVKPINGNLGHASINTKYQTAGIEAAKQMVITYLAGLVIENTFEKRNDIDKRFEKIIIFLNQRILSGHNPDDTFHADFGVCMEFADFISKHTNQSKAEVLIDGLSFIYKSIKNNDKFWETIDNLSNTLIDEGRLDYDQIHLICQSTGYTKI